MAVKFLQYNFLYRAVPPSSMKNQLLFRFTNTVPVSVDERISSGVAKLCFVSTSTGCSEQRQDTIVVADDHSYIRCWDISDLLAKFRIEVVNM